MAVKAAEQLRTMFLTIVILSVCSQAAETLNLWFSYTLAERVDPATLDVPLPVHMADLQEHIHTLLIKLSGNMTPTLRDAQGKLSKVRPSLHHTMMCIIPGVLNESFLKPLAVLGHKHYLQHLVGQLQPLMCQPDSW